MSESRRIRRFYAGGNTSKGFQSHYDQILALTEAKRVIILKGGPGVGKSTLMKRIGQELLHKGFDLEFVHCAADTLSLDAFVAPEIGVAMIDGTAPHVIDPKAPGAIDEIVNLGEFWNEAEIRRHRTPILQAGLDGSKHYQRAYRYLAVSHLVYQDIEAVNAEATDQGWMNQKANELIDTLLAGYPVAARAGRIRHLFASALTPDGPKHYLDSLFGPLNRRFIIKGEPGTGKSTFIQKVANAAVERGFFVELFHCPFDPEKLDHLIIPQLDAGLTTAVEPHIWYGEAEQVIDTSDALSHTVRQRYADELHIADQTYRALLATAFACLKKARACHQEREQYYIPSMCFKDVEALGKRLLDRILTV